MTLSNRVICCYIMVNIRSKFFRVNVSNHEEPRDGSSLSYFNIIYQPKSRRNRSPSVPLIHHSPPTHQSFNLQK